MAPTHDSRHDVLLDAADRHHGLVLDDAALVVRADDEAAEVRVARASVDLGAGDDGHFLPLDEADAPAEVRQHVLVQAEAEREDVVAFEEERALLGKEERKPRQVRAPRIDLGLGEVGVGRHGRDDVRTQPLRDVEARLKLAVDISGRRRNAAAGRHRRPHGQTPRPRSNCGSPVMSPARLVCVT